jgi:hypothetical protein
MLEALFTRLEAGREAANRPPVTPVTPPPKTGVTAGSRAIAGSNTGNTGNTQKESSESVSRDEGAALPPPWDAIRDRIHQGWRAVFGPPGPDGRQSIAWIPPGYWKPVQPDVQTEAPESSRQTAPTGGTMQRPMQAVRCRDCRHAQPIGHAALIRCGAGRESPAACGYWWKFDTRRCDRFTPRTSGATA